jgi:hypothetical protein
MMSGNDDRKFESTESLAFARMAQQNLVQTPEQIQAGIDACMREVIAKDSHHNPNATHSPEKTVPAGASPDGSMRGRSVGTNGWASEIPNQMPPGQEHIAKLADHFAPHGKESPLRKK